MPVHSIRKRCKDCKRTQAASPKQWYCPECGGELVTVKYGTKRRRRGST